MEASTLPEPRTEPGPASSGAGAAGSTGTDHAPLSRAVRAVSGVTLLSRLGGLIRDILIVRIFGNTAVGSAFAAAFAIPNMFRRLFGEGALSAAFIPAYTAALKRGRDDADRLASLTLYALGVVTGALTALIAAGLLVALWLLPADVERDLSLRLILVMIPFMPLICTAAILAGMLQVHGRFGPASSGPLVLNTFITAVGVYGLFSGHHAGETLAYVLGIATVLSGLTQVMWFRRLLRPHFDWRPDRQAARHDARVMLRRFFPVAIGLGTLQVNALIDTFIAMYPIWVGHTLLGYAYPLDDASNIILSQTTRLYQFPLGVFGIAVATAVFPLLSRQSDQPGAFILTLRRGLRLSLFIGLPASIGLVLVRHDLTAVLFGRIGGNSAGFDAQGVARSAAVLLGFAPGVWAYSLNHVLTRAFYALHDTTTPMRVAIGAVVFNFLLNLSLIWPLGEAGLAWATSLSAMGQTAVLWFLLQRRLDARASVGKIFDVETLSGMSRVLLASVLMGLLVLGGLLLLPGSDRWSIKLARVALATALGSASMIGLSKLLQVQELRWFFARSTKDAPRPAKG